MKDLKIDIKITEKKNVAFADDETKYDITISGHDENLKDDTVLKFCTGVLTNCNKSYDDETRNMCDPYYTFKRESREGQVSKYTFIVTSPFLD